MKKIKILIPVFNDWQSLFKLLENFELTRNDLPYKRSDIHVNFCYGLIANNEYDLFIDYIKKNIPLGRFAETSEIANLVTFLCSEKNSYITGQVIIIDGGYTCK